MVTAIRNKGSEATMGSIDAALKPRLRLRTPAEYAGWVFSILLGIGILVEVPRRFGLAFVAVQAADKAAKRSA